MKILNFGSLNIDYVYRVRHVVRPGETLSGKSFAVFAGGKGANQSAALARAGACVFHAGKVGKEGKWLVDKLRGFGVDTRFIRVTDDKSGHAVIQVEDAGENAIFLYPGTNAQIARSDVDGVMAGFRAPGFLLLQNEINGIPYIMRQARKRGLRICFNPAPFDDQVLRYPLDLVDVFILNETEGEGISGRKRANDIMGSLSSSFPSAEIVLTLGAKGAAYRSAREAFAVPGVKVRAVDTTAAGDTFIGYFLAGCAAGEPRQESVSRACRAAAICVSRKGAMDSIPLRREVKG